MAEPEPVHNPQGLVLSADEFEAALGLLVEEERRGSQKYGRRLLFNLAFTLAFVVGLFACPLGTLIRFVDPRLGQPLLVTGLIAAAIFTLLSTFKRDGIQLSSKDIRAAAGLDNAELDAPVEAGWRKRTQRANLILGLLLIPGLISAAAGLAWLLYSLLVLGTAPPLSLVLIAWPLLGLFVTTAVRSYQEYVYFSRVARLRRSFAARYVSAKRAEQAEVALSADEVQAVAAVQRRSLNVAAQQAVKHYAEAAPPALYASVMAPAAQAALRDLPPEAQARVHDQIDALQLNPRPPEARPTADGAGLVVFDGAHTVAYQLDDARQRLTVLNVTAAAPENAHDA